VSESAVPLEILYHFFKAAAAAGAGGVLGDKDGVLAHGGLLAVVRRISGREPLIDEVSGVSLHLFEFLVFSYSSSGPEVGTADGMRTVRIAGRSCRCL
jgi:hypothetical protein